MDQLEFSLPQDFNVFANSTAQDIQKLLVEQIDLNNSSRFDGVFRARGAALIDVVVPVMTWMRDNYDVPISVEAIWLSLQLRSIFMMGRFRIFRAWNVLGDDLLEYKVPEFPEELLYPLYVYLGEVPGLDRSLEWNQLEGDRPAEQHGYALMWFHNAFRRSAVLSATE